MNPKQAHTYRAPSDIDPYAKWLIRHKLSRLTMSGAITHTDGEDFSQELSLHVHMVTPKYDPARGARTTFFETVLSRRLSTLLAAHNAQKREWRRQRPLCDGRPSEEALLYDPWEQIDAVLDVRDVLPTVPGDLRPIAGMFSEMTEAEVVRATGLTRQRVRGRRERIARYFRSRGLG